LYHTLNHFEELVTELLLLEEEKSIFQNVQKELMLQLDELLLLHSHQISNIQGLVVKIF